MQKSFIRRALPLLAALVCAAGGAEAQPQSARVDLGGESAVSKSIVLPLNKAAVVELPQAAADVLVSQPTVVDAVIRSPQRVYLLGLTVGQTNAFFFDGNGRQILNLEIRVERDLDALTELMRRLMPNTRIVAEAVNDNIVLNGTADNRAEAANAADIAGRFIGDPAKVVSMVSVRQSEQVMLKVRIVEMQRQLVKRLGISGTGSITLNDAVLAFQTAAPVEAAAGLAGRTQVNNIGSAGRGALDMQFQALEQNGLVRVLAEPNLTAISGESAKFLAGGEYPVPVGSEEGRITIEFKEFGVGLGFTPVVLDKGRINMKISTEVSEITSDNSVLVSAGSGTGANGSSTTAGSLLIPGLSVRRANTTVELPSGGSLVMAGMLQSDMRAQIEGTPGLKETPVLGALFRSRDFQNNETELVIIATPYIVNPTSPDKLIDPVKGSVPATDAQALLLGKLLSPYGLENQGVREKTLQGPLGFILD